MEEIGAKIKEEDTKAILLSNLSSNYDNVNFTFNHFSSWSIDEIIEKILEKKKRMKLGDTEDNSHVEMTLFSKGTVNKIRTQWNVFLAQDVETKHSIVKIMPKIY